MGVFDYITFECSLPYLPEYVEPNHEFQTKSLRRAMDSLKVDIYGNLYIRMLDNDGSHSANFTFFEGDIADWPTLNTLFYQQ